MSKDMKEGRRTGRKPDVTHIRRPLMVYGARACEYGNDKYERANYMRDAVDSCGVPTPEDFESLREYLRACVDHVEKTLDSMEEYQAAAPELDDPVLMRRACYAADTDQTPGNPVPASGLPHLCGAVASLNMALKNATLCGLLPEDPGQPWRKNE